MPAGEFVVTCPGCGSASRLPFAALKRDSSYCSKCGKLIPLAGAQASSENNAAGGPGKPKRRPYRPARRR